MTPLLNAQPLMPDLHLKIEYMNPSLSIKHRAIPPAIFDRARRLDPTAEAEVVILTSGSAGISVAWAASRLACKSILLMPDSAKPSVVAYARQLGADVRCRPHTELEGLLDKYRMSPTAIVVDQLGDPSLIDRYRIVGEELLSQSDRISAITVAAGSSASVMGIALATKDRNIPVYAVEPAEAAVLAGESWRPHGIPGLAPPVPTRLFRRELVAGLIQIDSDTAWKTAAATMQATGEPVGPSSGAAIAAAMRLRREGIQGQIVSICPSHMAISL